MILLEIVINTFYFYKLNMFHHLSYYVLHIYFNFKIINFFIFIPQPNFLLLFYYEEQPVPKSIIIGHFEHQTLLMCKMTFKMRCF